MNGNERLQTAIDPLAFVTMLPQTQSNGAMQTRIEQLFNEKNDFIAKRNGVEADLAAAKRELAESETESVIAGHTVDAKLTKRVSSLSDQLDGLSAKIALWGRSIETLQAREAEEKGAREHQKREAFRKKAAPQLKRLMSALFEVRNSTQAFFNLFAEPDAPQLLDMTAFLFPQETHNPQDPFEGMNVRMTKMSILNSAMNWLADDLNHGRSGPQYPEGDVR